MAEQKKFADGNNEPYRMAIWSRRCRCAGRDEARRDNRGRACPLVVGIVTGRTRMDQICRGAYLVLVRDPTASAGYSTGDAGARVERQSC